MPGRDRDEQGRPRQARPRDALGRPLPYGDPRGVPPVPEEPLPPERALAFAQSLLDEGRAFSAHEVLEAVWKAAPEPERDLWQGLAQVCVAVTHAQRGNRRGSVALLERAARRLARYRAEPPHGVDVAGLLGFCAAAAGMDVGAGAGTDAGADATRAAGAAAGPGPDAAGPFARTPRLRR